MLNSYSTFLKKLFKYVILTLYIYKISYIYFKYLFIKSNNIILDK
ncbi:hypothetical protein EMA8858_02165 [Emticicia aquatica]|uniref:Uncharacterized protein n=1 Tax=Emticicia aquatica TaxID=1681835 RepID=A0ABN8EWS6_9BACT|nr:hypothetical protein EMA8858_02165 [Emticicia aquatica]